MFIVSGGCFLKIVEWQKKEYERRSCQRREPNAIMLIDTNRLPQVAEYYTIPHKRDDVRYEP